MVDIEGNRPTAAWRDRHARLVWWADSLAICVVCLVGGLAVVAVGEPIAVGIACVAIAVVSGASTMRARTEFRRGWRQGYESATRVMVERKAGRLTDVEVKATVDGDPTPEPWDRHVPLVVPWRSR